MHRKSVKAMKFHLYMICYADKYDEVRFFPADEVDREGGVKALELKLREDAAWFSPLGDIELHPDRRGNIGVRMTDIEELTNAWEERGSPKIIGKGKGPSPTE
jgi:hypothetical protein